MFILFIVLGHPASPFSDVPDVICQDYIPSPFRSSTYPSPAPTLNFLPKPPEVPPPPENYFADHRPRLSPSLSYGSAADCHFVLPLAPDVEGYGDDGVVEGFPRERLRIIEKLGEGHFEDVHLCEVVDSPEMVVVYTLRLKK